MFRLSLFLCILSFSLCGRAQTQPRSQPAIVPGYVRIPLDSTGKQRLISSLDGLLNQLSGPNKDNAFVQTRYLPETSELMDEIRGMDRPPRGWKDSCHCYLTNVNAVDSDNYVIQFSFLGIRDGAPVLRASFKLLAWRDGDRFLFSSPLRRNTAGWKVRKDGNFTFYYTDYPFNDSQLHAYVRKAGEFDSKLHAAAYRTTFYCCTTLQEALEVLGVDYKLDYNGYSSDNLSSFEQQTSLHVLGGASSTQFDFHDLWHDRLHAVVPVATINKPIDEACAYLYGGSWGLTWEEVFHQFKAFIGDNHDWLTAFTENKNFAQPGKNHLYASYVITALLANKIESEKGFNAVIELLTCGRYQPDNTNYFEALDRIIGVNKTNFNAVVEKLVEAEL